MPGLWDDVVSQADALWNGGRNPMALNPFLPPSMLDTALRPFLGQQQAAPSDQLAAYMADPTARTDADIQRRAAAGPPSLGQSGTDLADLVAPYLAGGAPAGSGVLSAGVRGGGPVFGPVTSFPAVLRQMHLADPNAIPLYGARQEVTLPPHIRNMDDFDALVQRNADLAERGQVARPWYRDSGEAINYATGGDQPLNTAFAGGLSRTSPGTDVASNATHAITLHNQAAVGDPMTAGRFPVAMGGDVARYYYGGEPPEGGVKTGPFHNAIGSGVWVSPEDILATPNPHTHVNDIWNMRASEFPGPTGRIYTDAPGVGHNGGPPLDDLGALYEGTPTAGQHNFTRIVSTAMLPELQRRTPGIDWLLPEERQAASWTGIKSLVEGTTPEEAGKSFQHGLQANYGQGSWESAPGTTTGHLQEYFDAHPDVQQEYHDAIKSVLLDDQGRDILAMHHGLLTGPAFDAPGAFEGRVSPGTQSQYALGQAPGGWQQGVDPASRQLATRTEVTRALLLGQDAAAWHKPTYAGGPGLTGKSGVAQANMVNADIGRPLTRDEAAGLYGDLTDRMTAAGAEVPDFFSPVGHPSGFRLLNVPEVTGISNEHFQQIARDAISNKIEGDIHVGDAHFDGDYVPNDWKENPGGENYRSWLSATGSPDLQRRSKELLAVLGPRVAQVQDAFAAKYGWTPNRATRFWETDPDLQAHQGAVVPSPIRPWDNPPAVRSPPRPPKGLLEPEE